MASSQGRMMSVKYLAMNFIFAVVLLGAGGAFAQAVARPTPQGLDLGETQLQGKKDQPEAMTFVSRAPLEMNGKAVRFNGKDLIKEEVKKVKLFDVSYEK